MSATSKTSKRGCSGESSAASKSEKFENLAGQVLGPPVQGTPWLEAFDLEIQLLSERQPNVQRSLGFKVRFRASRLGIVILFSAATLVYAFVKHNPSVMQRATNTVLQHLK